MTIQATTLTTPLGELALLARDDVLVAAGFAPVAEMTARLAGDEPVAEVTELGRLSQAVAAYFAGDLRAMDDLPVSQPGGPFFQAAWKVMRDIAPGETITYTELASRAGSPGAVRAAGSACARNRIAPIVPCHRVVRTGGEAGGYYYGPSAKAWLLRHEAADDDGRG
jgi:methylated-DNA-[protein]-cysteine S-methyltransferase